MSKREKQCKHENQHIQSWLVDGAPWRVNRTVRLCLDCNAWLPLGPARDTPQTAVELRAAEIAAQVRDAGEFDSARGTFGEAVGWHVSETFGDDGHPLIRYGADVAAYGGEAGYLANVIYEHDDATHDADQAKAGE